MKSEEQVKQELEKHKECLKENKFSEDKHVIWLHECIIEGLEWVLK